MNEAIQKYVVQINQLKTILEQGYNGSASAELKRNQIAIVESSTGAYSNFRLGFRDRSGVFHDVANVTDTLGITGIQGVTGSLGIYNATELPLGLPMGGFTPGIFNLQSNDFVTPVLDEFNALLLAISPAAPTDLTGTLVLTNTTKYSAILPTGLTSIWYSNGKVAGDTTSDYIVDNTYNLSSPTPTTSFKVGSTFGGDVGTVSHLDDGVITSQRNVTSGIGTTGDIQITDVSTYKTIWRKANAQINYTQSTEGFKRHALRYSYAAVNQDTSDTFFWYDDVNATPIVSLPTVVENTLSSSKYLSGIRYYDTGDTFDTSSTISDVANKSIRPTNPISYVMPGVVASNVAITGSAFAYNDVYTLNPTISINSPNAYSINSYLTVTGTKPSGLSASNVSASLNRLVNTYSSTYSTNGNITMFDEKYRYNLADDFSVIPGSPGDPVGDWVSSSALANGNLQLYGSTWKYPTINFTTGYFPTQGGGTDYSGFTGDQLAVWAANIGNSHSSMRIVFVGVLYSDIAPVGTGNLNIEIRLPATTAWLDAGRAFGDGNGCQVGSSSGNTLNLTFGTYSSSGSSGVVFIRVTLRNNSAVQASSLTVSGT